MRGEPYWRHVGPGRFEVVYPDRRGASGRVLVVGSQDEAEDIILNGLQVEVDPTEFSGSIEVFFKGRVRHARIIIRNGSTRPVEYHVYGERIKPMMGLVNARDTLTLEPAISVRHGSAFLEINGLLVAEYHKPSGNGPGY